MSANNDGLSPARNKTRDVLAKDGLTENSTTKNVSDGAIGGLPHLLQAEL